MLELCEILRKNCLGTRELLLFDNFFLGKLNWQEKIFNFEIYVDNHCEYSEFVSEVNNFLSSASFLFLERYLRSSNKTLSYKKDQSWQLFISFYEETPGLFPEKKELKVPKWDPIKKYFKLDHVPIITDKVANFSVWIQRQLHQRQLLRTHKIQLKFFCWKNKSGLPFCVVLFSFRFV